MNVSLYKSTKNRNIFPLKGKTYYFPLFSTYNQPALFVEIFPTLFVEIFPALFVEILPALIIMSPTE